jgi:GH15 family glucan-1,4-alpha-glucosidase
MRRPRKFDREQGGFVLGPIDTRREDGYVPIEHYALIGDCHGSALVAGDGSIDWCCLNRFDAPPIFSRILDSRRGGFFEIGPDAAALAQRRYVPETCLLETVFATDTGICQLIDFMPVGRAHGSAAAEYTSLIAPSWIIRTLTGVRGRVRLRAIYRPVAGFDAIPRLRLGCRSIKADGCPTLWTDLRFEHDGTAAVASFEIEAGAKRCLVLADQRGGPRNRLGQVDELQAVTEAFWTEWTRFTSYYGPHRDAVVRSSLVLKALTYSPTGAIVAAPTTSLPEDIGGVRNWDYRYCWIRDACFALYALQKLGHIGEAIEFVDFIVGAVAENQPELLPLYGILGETDLEEREIGHYDGYRGSRPVRVGNKAVEQHQRDLQGQLLDLLYFYCRLGGDLNGETRTLALNLVDFAARHWHEPDAGLWEPRLPPRRHVHSAIMAWVALDRGIRLFGERPHWVEAREAIVAELRDNAIHPSNGHVVGVIGGEALDAAVLIAPMVDFPLDRETISRTIDEIDARLGHWPLVYRYRAEDGLPGEEGTFLVCAFWLIDALLAVGRGDDARRRFDALLSMANDLGLFPEEMSESVVFLGNFPQAFTHLGILKTALVLDLYECGGADAVRGTYADRALRDTRYRKLAPISGAPFAKSEQARVSKASILRRSIFASRR